ncbi:MAG: LemA family protein [Dehalococcoidales bacterium]
MSPQTLSIIIAAVIGLLAIGCIFAAFRAFKCKRTIDDCPTSKTRGVFIGLTELKGTAESETPFTAYLSGKACVQYEWQVDEHWSRIVHETYIDSEGRTQSRTRTESGWKKIAGKEVSAPFYLKDETGLIRIVPEKAKIENIKVFEETCTPKDILYFGKCPVGEIADTTHRRRFYESAIPLHSQLYIIGQAREREDIVAAEIAYNKNAPMFLISTRTEKQLSTSYLWGFWLWFIGGLLTALGVAAALTYIGTENSTFLWEPFAITAAIYFLVFVLSWVFNVYNSLINLHNRVKQGWSQVDIQLKRRHDLIPNLVSAVEGYRGYEADIQCLLGELRTQGRAPASEEDSADFKGVAPLFNIIIECYPELKASQNFLHLQKELSSTEQRIALARDYYNEIATYYNTRLEVIPDRFVAFIAGLRPRTLTDAADFERAPVQVKLAE